MKSFYLFLTFSILFYNSPAFVKAETFSAPVCSITSVLRVGSKSSDVKCLQEKLGIAADGSFGPFTRGAVIAFQSTHNLKTDGIVGLLSRQALFNDIAVNINYPPGCTSNVGYSTTTGNKCDGSSSPLAQNFNANTIIPDTTTKAPLSGPKLSNANPNTKNLDSYVAAVKTEGHKEGLSDNQLTFIEDKIRKHAASNSNFLQQFFDTQKALYLKKVSEHTPEGPVFAVLNRAISFIDETFSVKEASAGIGLPFGGYITFVDPEICDCPAGVVTQIFVSLPNATASSDLLLNYVNGTEGFLYHNIPEPSIAVLGSYTPGTQSCITYVSTGCVPFPAEGQITPTVGSSATP